MRNTINKKSLINKAFKATQKAKNLYSNHQAWIYMFLANGIFLILYTTQLSNFATTSPAFPSDKTAQPLASSALEYQLNESQQIDQKIREVVEQIQNSPEDPTINLDIPTSSQVNTPNQNVNSSSYISTHLANLNVLITSNSCKYSSYQGICQIAQFSYFIPLLISLYILVKHLRNKKISRKYSLLEYSAYISLTILFFTIAISITLYNAHKQAKIELQQSLNILNGTTPSELITQTTTLAEHIAQSSQVPLLITTRTREQIVSQYLSSIHPQQTYVQTQLLPQHLNNNSTQIESHFILLPNNQLLINNYDFEDLQTLLPILSKQIIEEAYGDIGLDLSQTVSFNVLGSVEYQKFHEQKEAEQKAIISEFIGEIRSSISEINSFTAQNTQSIQRIDSELAQLEQDQVIYVKELEDLYNQYCTNNKDHPDCKELQNTLNTNRALIDEYRAQLQASKDEVQLANQEATQYKQQFQSDLTTLNELLTLIERNPINTEHLLGVYFPSTQEILIKYEDGQQDYAQITSEDATAQDIALAKHVSQLLTQYDPETTFIEYLSTAIHEQLHSISFQEEDLWPRFLEEGYTEYLTIQAISPHLTDADNLGLIGYAHQVQQVQDFQNTIPEAEFTRNYFQDKSSKTLEELFLAAYPDIDVDDLILKSEGYFYIGYSDLEARDELKNEIDQTINPESKTTE